MDLRSTACQEPPTSWMLPCARINSVQQWSIRRLVKRCKQAHFVNVRIRINGEWEEYEADWIKHMQIEESYLAQCGRKNWWMFRLNTLLGKLGIHV